jgi:hypothetical protein
MEVKLGVNLAGKFGLVEKFVLEVKLVLEA